VLTARRHRQSGVIAAIARAYKFRCVGVGEAVDIGAAPAEEFVMPC
jgi:hypothetical protein